jgi:manganese/zinc/iron transport system permease protein
MEFLVLLFTDYTLRTVALGAAVLGVVSGALGSYAVLRRQSLLGDAMSHAALPGVVIAFILTGLKTPLVLILGAAVAGWLGALLVMLITGETRLKQDSALGIVLAVFFGFGLVLLTWVQRQGTAGQSGLDRFLFGRAAAMVMQDVIVMAVLGAIALGLVFLFWKEFKLLSFDPDFGASLGFPIRVLDILLTTLIVIAIVIGLQTVGVVLMSAMIVAPAAAARQWTDRLDLMVAISAFFGALAGVSGALISSLTTGLATGPTIVLCASLIVALSLLIAPNRGLVWNWLQRQRNRQRLRTLAVLEALYRMGLHHGDPYRPHSLRSLQATVRGRGVNFTLQQLAARGWVRATAPDEWALTTAGLARLQEQLQSMGGRAAEEAAGGDLPGNEQEALLFGRREERS